MSVATLGYRSRVDAYAALAEAGKGEAEICREMAVGLKEVRRIARYVAARARRRERATPLSRTVCMDELTFRRLSRLAAEEGVTARTYAARLLEHLGEEPVVARNIAEDVA